MSDQGNGPTKSIMDDIGDTIDTDEDMYDVGDDNGPDDDGSLDTADSDSDTGDAGQSVQDGGTGEPDLPMELPRQGTPPPAQYDAENPRGYARVGHLFADEKGNIVTRDGRVMAAAGEAARHWSNMSRSAAQVPTLQRQNEALTRQISANQQLIQTAKELADLPQRMGVSRQDYNTGVELIARWNQDPLTICREMVARTMARGFNTTDILGKEAGNAIEMSALRNILDEATAGQRQREQVERSVAENRRTAEANYNAFMSRYPDSAPHADAIANLMNSRGISAVEAYHELRHFALQERLDWNSPLGAQLAARQRQPVQPPPPNRQTQRAPMVAGNGGGNRDHLANGPMLADANSSWGDILNEVMRSSA